MIAETNSRDNTPSVVEAFKSSLPITYLKEEQIGFYGKSHALNRAIDHGGLGELTAVLDDDISVDQGWFQGVRKISGRFQEADVFAGNTRILWPDQDTPAWALNSKIRSWMFSAVDYGEEDRPLADGMWFSGNHFWFRSSVLKRNRRFNDLWLTEPDFMLQLVEEGFAGRSSPEALVWHRVQPSLLDQNIARKRAILVGVSFARIRIQPPRTKVKHSALLKRHPLSGRLFCYGSALLWYSRLLRTRFGQSGDDRFAWELVCLERFSNYKELFSLADKIAVYSNGIAWKLAGFLPRLEKFPISERISNSPPARI